MQRKIIYIKPSLNSIVTSKSVKLGQIVKVYGNDETIISHLKECEIFTIEKSEHCKYAVTILKIIQEIERQIPELLILNEGVSDFIVEYVPQQKKKPFLEVVKVIFICFTIFFGSAFTIMTFNEDVSVAAVLQMLNTLVMGEKQTYGVLEISYSLGLPIGILFLFNHFSKKKMEQDPTPLQVQLRIFEMEENKAIIENSSRAGKTIDVD